MCRDQAPSPLTPLTLDHPLGQIIAVLVALGQMRRTATSLILLLLLVNNTNSPQKHLYFSLFSKGMLIAIFLLFPKVWDKQHHCTPPTGHITQQLPLHQPSPCQPHLVMRPGLTSPVLLPSPTQAGPSPLTMLLPPTSPCQLSTSLQPCLTCSLPTTYLSISKLLTLAQSLHIIGSAGLFWGEWHPKDWDPCSTLYCIIIIIHMLSVFTIYVTENIEVIFIVTIVISWASSTLWSHGLRSSPAGVPLSHALPIGGRRLLGIPYSCRKIVLETSESNSDWKVVEKFGHH